MEKYRKILLVLFIFAFFFVNSAAQEGFDVDIERVQTEIYPTRGDVGEFRINVTSNFNRSKTFSIGYNTGTATDSSWYFLDNSFVRIEPGESSVSTLYVELREDDDVVAGNRGPEVYVYPSEDPGNKYSELVTFRIRREEVILITDFKSPKSSYDPDEPVELAITFRNVVQEDYDANTFEVDFNLGNETRTESVSDLDSGDDTTVSTSFDITDYDAGDYNLVVEVKDFDTGEVIGTKSGTVRVNEFERYNKDVVDEDGFLWKRRNMTILNTGNTVIESEKLSSNVKWYEMPFITFEKEPDTVEDLSGAKELYWEVNDIERNSMKSISYSTNYWSAVIVFLIVGVVSMIVYKQLHSVSVVKFVKRGKRSVSVNVRIRNNTGRRVENVKVEDFVPGIASLVKKFDSKNPDRIQKNDEGTRIQWNISEMEPGEERIFVYNIKPRIRVEGSINLPEAKLVYEVEGRRLREESHSVSADFS